MSKLRKADVLARLEQGKRLFTAEPGWGPSSWMCASDRRNPTGGQNEFERVHLSAFNALVRAGIIQPIRTGSYLQARVGFPLDKELAWYETEWALKAGAA